MTATQMIFNPINYGFEWTQDGWYSWDRATATKAARRDRDAAIKAARKEGREARAFSISGQLITRGGIGSGHPQIEEIVTVFGANF